MADKKLEIELKKLELEKLKLQSGIFESVASHNVSAVAACVSAVTCTGLNAAYILAPSQVLHPLLEFFCSPLGHHD